jgi:hypothetical protein
LESELEMMWFWWLIIGVGLLFILLFVLAGIILYRVSVKNKIRVNILMKARIWKRFKIKIRTLGKTIKYNEVGYVFDDKAIIKGKYCDNIYYYEGNPEPIIFDFGSNIPKTQAKDLQTILDSDLIEKLFSEKRLATMEILLWIILIATGITLLAVIGGMFKTVSIANDVNREFLYNITRSAILGY